MGVRLPRTFSLERARETLDSGPRLGHQRGAQVPGLHREYVSSWPTLPTPTGGALSWTEVDGHLYLVVNKQRVPLLASFKERQLKAMLEEEHPGVASGAGAALVRIVDCEGLDYHSLITPLIWCAARCIKR